MKTEYPTYFFNLQISNVPKKSVTGFCMVQLASLPQTSFAGNEEDITMNMKHHNNIVLTLIVLTMFSTNVFSYSKQELSMRDASIIKTAMAKPERSAYSQISRSPDVINNLRLMFSSSQKNKLPR